MKTVIFFMSTLTATLAHAAAPAATVVIRTYNDAALPAAELAAARSEAGRIFMKAGISLDWTETCIPFARLQGARRRPGRRCWDARSPTKSVICFSAVSTTRDWG